MSKEIRFDQGPMAILHSAKGKRTIRYQIDGKPCSAEEYWRATWEEYDREWWANEGSRAGDGQF